MTELTLPASLESVGESCFYSTQITTMTCYALVPPATNEWILPSTMIDEPGTLYVLNEVLEDYKVATGWEKAFRILPIEEEIPETDRITDIWFGAESYTFENSEEASLQLLYSPDDVEIPEVLWNIFDSEMNMILEATTSGAEISLNILSGGEYLVTAKIYNSEESETLEARVIVIILQGAGVDSIVKDQEVEIYNMNGLLIYKGVLENNSSGFTPGLYVIKSGSKTYKTLLK